MPWGPATAVGILRIPDQWRKNEGAGVRTNTMVTEDDHQGETQRRLPAVADRVSLPSGFGDRETGFGTWTALHSAVFLLFSTVFLFAGAGILYQTVMNRLGLQFDGAVLGAIVLGLGIVMVAAAVAALFGSVRAPVVTGVIGIVAAVAGGWLFATVPEVGAVFAVPAAVGILLAWRAHLELRDDVS